MARKNRGHPCPSELGNGSIIYILIVPQLSMAAEERTEYI